MNPAELPRACRALGEYRLASNREVGIVKAMQTAPQAVDHVDIFTLPSQTSRNDRIALLQLQNWAASSKGRYTYGEIGSYLGGTLVPHLWDERCTAIISVDPRPQAPPDARGKAYVYTDNSTAAMLDLLRSAVPPASLAKLTTYDMDARDLPAAQIPKLDLAFIDGEHTNIAAFSDFVSLLPLMSKDSIIAFHDTDLVGDAFANVERLLQHLNVGHQLFVLPDCVGVLASGSFADDMPHALRSAALGRAEFAARSRARLLNTIAENVIRDGVLPLARIAKALSRRARGK